MDEFMKDRYGVDELTYLMGLASMATALIGSIFDLDPLLWTAIAGIALALLRAFSKNIAARERENTAFMGIMAKIPGVASLLKRINMGGTHVSNAGNGTIPTRDTTNRKAEREARRAQLESQKNLAKKMWKQRKTHAFLKCPQCGQTLSVPKGKGKLIVTCPKCRTRMKTKS